MFRRIINNKGSALVWAVCAMMILTLVTASMLTLASAYYDRSLKEAMLEKAKLMAQSGANYAVHMLDPVSDDFSEDWVPINATNRGETAQRRVYLSGGTSDYDEFVTLTFSSAESSSNDEDKINSGEAIRVYLLKVRAEAICGDSIAHCSAVFWGYGEDGIWNFTGFVQD